MSKIKTIFQCQSCGFVSPKWLGKCPDCGTWNSFLEEKQSTSKGIMKRQTFNNLTLPLPITDIDVSKEDRLTTGIEELDRVLGGGIVSGSLILIGGDPGIGKSTLVLQLLNGLFSDKPTSHKPRSLNLRKALYISGEESLKQIKLRANRLNIDNPNIVVLSETCIEDIFAQISDLKPSVLVIDSIQTVFTQEVPSAPGSVGQVRESASQLMHFAKQAHVPTFIVGHVTKEGAIAGPRVLEHIVDTVLYFEGNRGHSYRILRAVKNRFGSTNEIGIFEMRDHGLIEISNPSELFLSEKPENISGTTVASTIEGTRPLMVEIQALVSQSTLGIPRRTSIGVDINRVNLLIAVLEKIGGFHLGGMDIFLNIVGGLRVVETAIDLGVITTIASSFKEIPIKEKTFLFGEVGLSGEIRAVSQAEARIKEGSKIGFKEAILPYSNLDRINIKPKINLIGVKNINEALRSALRD